MNLTSATLAGISQHEAAVMYEKHRSFEPPSDENAVIWRYIDFAKLVSMLQTQSLHFTRVDHFQDAFEGALPRRLIERVRELREESRRSHPQEWVRLQRLGRAEKSGTEHYQDTRRRVAANCWHQNEHESMAMWSQYVKDGDGIAIRSSFKRLVDSFDDPNDEYSISVGIVRYIDYETELGEDFNNTLLPVTHKRMSFQHEQELRAVVLGRLHDAETGKPFLSFEELPESGVDVGIHVDKLIESICVFPGAPRWFTMAVASVAEKYRLGVPIGSSSLDDQPLW